MPTPFCFTTVQEGVIWLGNTVDQVVADTLHVCRIPAPTFDEAERAAYVAERMRAIGLDAVHLDAISNVTGILRHAADHPTTLVVAHIDTVFPRATPLPVRRTTKRLYGPGIGDNSVAVAAMLRVAAALQGLRDRPPGQVIFAASVGEEGLGNLCGIRALLHTWHGQIDTVIAVEGHGLDAVRHSGIGSTRLEVTFQGPGGHSWEAFGLPSAIHAMGSTIHRMAQLEIPQHPKTTYNVGLVAGGESVNTIAPRATLVVDLRSVDPDSLQRLGQRVARLLHVVEQETGIRISSRMVGQRPAAALAIGHPLCQGVETIRTQLRLRRATFSAASTDANLPLSQGLPAICLGITRGGLAHTVREYIDIAPIAAGMQQLFLTILHTLSNAACGVWNTE
ncbi:Acetylornithine deacetylase [Candidatus Entotheonellaceae bacterium PAL068K]